MFFIWDTLKNCIKTENSSLRVMNQWSYPYSTPWEIWNDWMTAVQSVSCHPIKCIFASTSGPTFEDRWKACVLDQALTRTSWLQFGQIALQRPSKIIDWSVAPWFVYQHRINCVADSPPAMCKSFPSLEGMMCWCGDCPFLLIFLLVREVSFRQLHLQYDAHLWLNDYSRVHLFTIILPEGTLWRDGPIWFFLDKWNFTP